MTETEKKLLKLSLQFFGESDDDDGEDFYDDDTGDTDDDKDGGADSDGDDDSDDSEEDERIKKLKDLGYEGNTMEELLDSVLAKADEDKKKTEANKNKKDMADSKNHINGSKPGNPAKRKGLDAEAERRVDDMMFTLSKVTGKKYTREETRRAMLKNA